MLYKLIGLLIRHRSKPVIEIDRKGMKRALIVNLQGMGDVLMTTPLIHELAKNMEVDVLTIGNLNKNILQSTGETNRVLSYHNPWKTKKQTKDTYDLIYLANGAGPKSGLLFWLLRAKRKASHIYYLAGEYTAFGADIALPQTARLHRVDEHLKLLSALGLPRPQEPHYSYRISPEAKQWADAYWKTASLQGKKTIAIHPGGDKNNPEKRYPLGRYLALVEKLPPHYHALFIIGPDEKELLRALEHERKTNTSIVSEPNIEHIAALLAKCEKVLHSDSGIGHLAAAVGTKTLTIAGPTNWYRTKPYGKKDQIIIGENCPEPRDEPMEKGFIDKKRAVYYPASLPLAEVLR